VSCYIIISIIIIIIIISNQFSLPVNKTPVEKESKTHRTHGHECHTFFCFIVLNKAVNIYEENYKGKNKTTTTKQAVL